MNEREGGQRNDTAREKERAGEKGINQATIKRKKIRPGKRQRLVGTNSSQKCFSVKHFHRRCFLFFVGSVAQCATSTRFRSKRESPGTSSDFPANKKVEWHSPQSVYGHERKLLFYRGISLTEVYFSKGGFVSF